MRNFKNKFVLRKLLNRPKAEEEMFLDLIKFP